jgi:membrane protein
MFRSVAALARDTVAAWIDDYAPSMGAALAYYTMFSIAPLLLIVIAVAGLVFGEQAARGEIVGQLRMLIGPEGAAAIESLLVSVNDDAGGVVATLSGMAMLLLGATTVFAELQGAMDRIWRSPRPPRSGLWAFLLTRLLSLGLILGIGFLLIVSLVASAALAAFGRWWAPLFGDARMVVSVLDFGLSFAFVTTGFAMIYKWMPRVQLRWSDVWIGAVVTALLFTIGKSLIGTYLGNSGISSAFGAAGSLVAVVAWVYYSAQVFLLGVEFTQLYARRHGSLREPAGHPRGFGE